MNAFAGKRRASQVLSMVATALLAAVTAACDGGPVFSSNIAYGIHVATSHSNGCLSYYQGVRAVEDALDVDILHA